MGTHSDAYTQQAQNAHGTTVGRPSSLAASCHVLCYLLWTIIACVYLCLLGSMCVSPGYESFDSEFLCRTARQWSQHVSNSHPTCCANSNHHRSKHTDWETNRGGYGVVQSLKLNQVSRISKLWIAKWTLSYVQTSAIARLFKIFWSQIREATPQSSRLL